MYKLRFGLCSSKYDKTNTPATAAETRAEGSPALLACAALAIVIEGIWKQREYFNIHVTQRVREEEGHIF